MTRLSWSLHDFNSNGKKDFAEGVFLKDFSCSSLETAGQQEDYGWCQCKGLMFNGEEKKESSLVDESVGLDVGDHVARRPL